MSESNGQFTHLLSVTCRDDGSGTLSADVFDAPNTMHVALGTLELCPSQQHVEDDDVHEIHRCCVGLSEGGPGYAVEVTSTECDREGDVLIVRVQTAANHNLQASSWRSQTSGFGIALTPSGLQFCAARAVSVTPQTVELRYAADANTERAARMQCQSTHAALVVGRDTRDVSQALRIRAPAGNYDARALAGSVAAAMDGLVCAPGATMILRSARGAPVPVLVGTGAAMTVEFLQGVINAQLEARSADLRLELRLRSSDQRLTVASEDGAPFDMDFRRCKVPVNPRTLGFRMQGYGGASSYTGEFEVALSPSLDYTWTCDPNCNRLTLLSDAREAVMQDGVIDGPSVLPLRTGDVVHLPDRGLARVSAVAAMVGTAPDGELRIAQRLHLHEFADADLSGRILVRSGVDCSHALLMGSDVVDHAIPPPTLGFEPGVNQASQPGCTGAVFTGSGTHTLRARADAAVEHPPFVLLELIINGSHGIHANFSSVPIDGGRDGPTTTPFAKIGCAHYRTERHNPAAVILSTPLRVRQVGIRLFNPDHTPYNTHGRPVSISLVLTGTHQMQ